MTTDSDAENVFDDCFEDKETEPRFCHFCQDRVPEGRVILVNSVSYEVVSRTDFKICQLCGRRHDGQVLGTKDDNPDEKALLQFEHFEFKEESVDKMAALLENMVCHVCDEAIERDDTDIPARAFATKMMRMSPEADSIAITCSQCSSLGLCPCCNETDED